MKNVAYVLFFLFIILCGLHYNDISSNVPRSLLEEALAAWEEGRYSEAVDIYMKLLKFNIDRWGGEHPNVAITLDNLGIVYQDLGDYINAEDCHKRALVIYNIFYGEEYINTLTARSYNNLGLVYCNLEDYEIAKTYFERALDIFTRLLVREHTYIARTFNNLGLVHYKLGDYESAKKYYENALAVFIRLFGEEHAYTAVCLNNLGTFYHNLGDNAKAKDYIERALVIQMKLYNKDHVYTALSLNNMGNLYIHFEKKDTAIFFLKMAVNMTQSIRTRITSLDRDLQKSFLQSKESYYHSLADLLIEQGRVYEAQQVLTMLKEEEYFDYIRRDKQNDSRSTTVSYSQSELKQVDRFKNIAEGIYAINKEKNYLLDKKKTILESEWVSSQDEIRLKELIINLESLTNDIFAFFELLETELKAEPGEPDEVISELSIGIQETLKNLGHDVALIHTLIAPAHVWLILTTSDTHSYVKKDIQREELYKRISAFRESMFNWKKDNLKAAQDLYDVLIAPISIDIIEAGSHTLMFYLDGPLRYIPMSALHDGEKWLVETYSVVVYTDAAREKLFAEREMHVKTSEAAAMGVTKAHRNLEPLIYVREELESIIWRENAEESNQGFMCGIILLDNDFTEAAFIGVLSNDIPVLHVASHFNLEPGDISRSCLLLGDGKDLTLESFREERFRLEKVDLLTLSACNTAIDFKESTGRKGREMESFGVLAQKKGAMSVIATLWPIADKSTGILMPHLYSMMYKEGVANKAEALRQTQIMFINGDITNNDGGYPESPASEDIDYSHPYFWAPFILMGNWL